MVTVFRMIEGKIRPMGSSPTGISISSIGTPARTSFTGATPKTIKGSGSPFSPQHALNRLFEASKKAKELAETSQAETKGSQNARDQVQFDESNISEAEMLRKERAKEQSGNINTLRDKIKDIAVGRSKKQKEKNKEQKQEIKEVLKDVEENKWQVDNFNIGSSIQALKFQVALKGDRDAQKIIDALTNNEYKKAKKLLEERKKKLNNVFAEKSRIESEEAEEVLSDSGLVKNVRGEYIPTEETPEIVSEKLDIPVEEAEIIKEVVVQAPPKLSPTEVGVLSSTEAGREQLRKWGYAKQKRPEPPERLVKSIKGGTNLRFFAGTPLQARQMGISEEPEIVKEIK